MQGLSRVRGVGDDQGQATLESVGLVVVIATLVAAVVAAFAVNVPVVGSNVATAICSFITVGGCGAPEEVQTREPTAPCLVAGASDTINAGIDFTVVGVGVGVGGNRPFAWEELSDGRFRVTQRSGGDVQATTGIGGKVAFTVADTEVGAGAEAGISGGVAFSGGQEWLVDGCRGAGPAHGGRELGPLRHRQPGGRGDRRRRPGPVRHR